MTNTQKAIFDEIETVRKSMPVWFGGRPLIRIPLEKALVDKDRECIYVTLEDVAEAFGRV